MNPLPFIPIISDILDRVIPNKTEAQAAKNELENLAVQGKLDLQMAQIRTNQQEARHKSVFVAGWRPFIGWVCGAGLAYTTIIAHIIGIFTPVPPIDTALLLTTMGTLLGVGSALDVYENIKTHKRG